MTPTPDMHDLKVAAEDLLGRSIHRITAGGRGENSKLFCLHTARETLALKSYPTRRGDGRARAKVEWAALNFLRDHGLSAVPAPIARDPDDGFLVLEWINGHAVDVPREADIRHAAAFVSDVFALSRKPGAEYFPPASEACLSAAEIVSQIDQRLVMLVEDAAVRDFLDQEIRPAFAAAKEGVGDSLLDPVDLAPEQRCLIPADFGFHNALREADDTLRYVDFDYFGWDDPVKLVADFILHPAMRLGPGRAALFASEIEAALTMDQDFRSRLKRHLPLFAVRWALIVLNPFRTDRLVELPDSTEQKNRLRDGRLATATGVMQSAGRLDRI